MDQKFSALSDLVDLIGELANEIMKAPKPLGLSSLALFLPLLPKIEAVAKEVGDLVPELKVIDLAEGEALLAQLATSLAITDQKTKDVLAASLKLIAAGSELFKAVKE